MAQIVFIFLEGSNMTSEKKCHMKKYIFLILCDVFYSGS